MRGTIRVTGGVPLRGTVTPIPNKNSLMAVIPAAVLSGGKSVYLDVPHTSDIEKLVQILKLLGAEVDDRDYARLSIDGSGIKSHTIDQELGGQFRASFMFVGPLLARFGVAEVPMPGGCSLGERSISVHVDLFKKMGVSVTYENEIIKFVAPKKFKPTRIWQLEASVTGTENIAMLAAGIESEIEIIDAASEPHVVDLLEMLSGMGAEIKGIGTNHLVIRGKNNLRGGKFSARPDFVDIAGFMAAAALTKGEIRISGANIPVIVDGLINWFEAFNINIERDEGDLVVRGDREMVIDLNKTGVPLASKSLPKLAPRPWPGFPVDVLPVMVTLASKAKGRLLINNWMYESGLDFVREMNGMGADIFIADPQRIIVNGPVTFKGGELLSPAVIQACKAIFLASLCDSVTTTIHGVDILRRRYPDIIEVYKSLGAKIEWVE